MVVQLQQVMAKDVGPLRTETGLKRALAAITALDADIGERPPAGAAFDLRQLEWFDLRNMLTVARSIATAALHRTESRGAHQREDHPGMLPQWRVNQRVALCDGRLALTGAPPEMVAS
jgi:succinate dehydrogenase/fumarate reductase flavoprotein subunit